MKIGIFQDVHANLPAFKKAMETFRAEGCVKIYHVGDLIGIGPHPKEVFDLGIAIPDLELIMGNHDYWYAFGLPNPIPTYMSADELAHQQWVHTQIGEERRGLAQTWKWLSELVLPNGNKIVFTHYGTSENPKWFKSIVKQPSPESLDELFDGIDCKLLFYGHMHRHSDLEGRARYVNLGSAGCYDRPEVRLGILNVLENNQVELKKLSVAYNDNGLMNDFEVRQVPARKFITSTFITR